MIRRLFWTIWGRLGGLSTYVEPTGGPPISFPVIYCAPFSLPPALTPVANPDGDGSPVDMEVIR